MSNPTDYIRKDHRLSASLCACVAIFVLGLPVIEINNSANASNPPINCGVRVTVPVQAQDSTNTAVDPCSSGPFRVQLTGTECPEVESYQWEWRVPVTFTATAMRVPTDFFDDASKANPIVTRPQWYVQKGTQWQLGKDPNCANGEPAQCKYEVRCTVVFKNEQCASSPWVPWTVYVYINSPTVTPPAFATNGGILYLPNVTSVKVSNNNYTSSVSNAGSLARLAPVRNHNGMQACNGFGNKIFLVHEGEHLNQWNNQAPWSDLYDADQYFADVSGWTDSGPTAFSAESNLRIRLRNELESRKQLSDLCKEATSGNRERAAHTLSNAVDPPFLNAHIDCWTAVAWP